MNHLFTRTRMCTHTELNRAIKHTHTKILYDQREGLEETHTPSHYHIKILQIRLFMNSYNIIGTVIGFTHVCKQRLRFNVCDDGIKNATRAVTTSTRSRNNKSE